MEDTTASNALDDLSLYQPNFEHASVRQRFVNYAVDTILYFVLCFFLLYVTGAIVIPAWGESYTISTMFPDTRLAFALLMPMYPIVYILTEGLTKGRTLGKLLTGTVAVKKDITAIDWKDALARSMIRIVPFEVLTGFGGRPWHDKFSNTYVVKKKQIIW